MLDDIKARCYLEKNYSDLAIETQLRLGHCIGLSPTNLMLIFKMGVAEPRDDCRCETPSNSHGARLVHPQPEIQQKPQAE